jgi:membrane fusion protein (multidrug efflux system)
MTKKVDLILSLIILVLIIFSSGCEKKEEPKKPTLQAVEVTGVVIEPRTLPMAYEFVAQTESSHQVEIVPRVNGFLEKIAYSEGEIIKEGQVMFLIDPKPFNAQLKANQAEVQKVKARLTTVEAEFKRVKGLHEKGFVSKSELDRAQGEYLSSQAMVYEANANVEKATLDLSYTTIHSPITGLASRSLIREGAYLNAGSKDSLLTYVAKLDPIWVNFSVSQNFMEKINLDVQKGLLVRPTENQFEVEIKMPNGSIYPIVGRINFADPSYSQDTGTFLVRADVANPDNALKPGMFVTAVIKGSFRPDAIVIPQAAVQQGAKGHFVYVVEKNTAQLRPVIVGEWYQDGWIIIDGLKAGETVIVDGILKVAEGSPVKLVEASKPKDSAQ